MLRAIASWLLLIPAFILFSITACIADVLIKLLYKLGKTRASRRCFVAVSQFSELLLKLWGTRIEFDTSLLNLDPKRPILFVSSHHSSLDVSLLGNHLFEFIGYRKLGFVCRGGLERWLPCFSFYTRQYCYSLTRKGQRSSRSSSADTIDRELPVFAQRIDKHGDALVFFPEGVKPLDEFEHCRSFRRKGLRILLENMPNAQIVPIGIAGTRSFFTTPRCLKSMLQNRPRFNCCLHFQVLPTLQHSHTENIEHTIDLLEAQIFSSYEKLSSRIHTQHKKIDLRQKWIQ